MAVVAAPLSRASWPRHVAAVLALVFALPSCITAMMWGQSQLYATDLRCDTAKALPAGDGAGVQIALRLSAESAAAIGVEANAVGGAWIVLQPEDVAGIAAFLQQARHRRVENVTFTVTFRPAASAGSRPADVRLRAEFLDEPPPGSIEDAWPDPQPRQVGDVFSRCQWQLAATPPVGGEALVPPAARVEDYRAGGLGVPAKMLLTPVTVACDVVLLPFEIIVAGMFLLAD